MKRLFYIPPRTELAAAESILLCDIADDQVSLALVDARTKDVQQLSYYDAPEGVTPVVLQNILDDAALAPAATAQTVTAYLDTQVAIVPETFYSTDQMALAYNNNAENSTTEVAVDRVLQNKLALVYTDATALAPTWPQAKSATWLHAYTPLLTYAFSTQEATALYLNFQRRRFTVLAKKDDALLLVQTYPYTAPADVLYYLLAICTQYGLPQTATSVVLMGLISEDSSLYKELFQYFLQVRFWIPANRVVSGDHPAHFFASIHNLAACAL